MTQAQTGPRAIAIRNARKVYPAQIGRPPRTAVADVSLSVDVGSIHGLLGPNGAGKTTTLKMLLGLVRPSGGEFEILGRRAGDPASRTRLGFLAEQPYFPTHLTAREIMGLAGRLVGMSRPQIAERSSFLLARVGLQGQSHPPLSKFSRGMLQRLGLAQALIGSPEVLILDEPASGLDPIGQADVRNLMLELAASGTTILLSSHQLSEVEAVCDKVAILDRGRVAAEGRIDDLLNAEGQTSIRVTELPGGLPDALSATVGEIAVSGTTYVFSVSDDRVREVVDAIDDAKGRVVSVSPKRESLEDYFAGLLETHARAAGASAADAATDGTGRHS